MINPANNNMESPTHYATLGVLQSAESSVIRAAYKALVLNHHPDKTIHLSAEERAHHSVLFRNVQEAFDVVGNPSLRVAYDRELERHGKVDMQRSTFHRPATPSAKARSYRRNTVRLTSPEEKRALKAKVEQDLAYLREQRAKRDMEDSQMDIAGLKFMLQTWAEMAEEYDDNVDGNGYLRAHCAVQIQIYQAKIARREREHDEWLESMSRPKTPGTPFGKSTRLATTNSFRPRTGGSSLKPTPRGASAKPTTTVPPSARAEDKARKNAAKQAQIDAKAAAVRTEKEKQKARVEEQARREADRVARVRAKAGAAPLGHGNTSDKNTLGKKADESSSATRLSVNKVCSCGAAHASFKEWRDCTLSRSKHEQDDDESFFRTV